MRVLAGIINHGTKNDVHLASVLDGWRQVRCRYDVDIVVLTNRPKFLGDDVEVRVESPEAGPLFLPLMPRRLFAERRGLYDVYVASEDDTPVTAQNIDAFVHASAACDVDIVPGFLRFEHWPPHGEMFIDTLHRYFSWDPFSTRQCGEWMFAEATNLASAVYMLSQDHLERAIASGRFEEIHRPTRLYDTLEAASTHVFEHCGLRKVVSINRIDDFLIHHLANRFHEWRMGLPLTRLRTQLEALDEIHCGRRQPEKLVDVHARLCKPWWDKCYDEPSRHDLLAEAGPGPADVLWLGASGSEAEVALLERGHRLTGIPLDSVVSKVAEQQGTRVTPADIDEGLAALEGQSFDVIYAVHMFERLPDPIGILKSLGRLLAPGGRLVCVVPNFDRWWRWPHDNRRLSQAAPYGCPWTFEQTGLHFTTSSLVRQWLQAAGMGVSLRYPRPDQYRRYDILTFGRLRRRMAYDIIAVARHAPHRRRSVVSEVEVGSVIADLAMSPV